MHQDDGTCKCMQCNAKFSNLWNPFTILSNFLAYLQTFKLFAYFLHLVSTFCVVGGTNLVISTQGGGPPQFYRSTGPLSIGFFLRQMHLVGIVPIESRHSTRLSGFIFATVSFALTVFLFSPSSLLCSLFSCSPGISANFQAFCIFPPPGLQFLQCWWHKPCYFHTRGCTSQFYKNTGPLSIRFFLW